MAFGFLRSPPALDTHAAMRAPDPMRQTHLAHHMPTSKAPLPPLSLAGAPPPAARHAPSRAAPCRTLMYPAVLCCTEHTCDDLRVGQLGAAMWDKDGRVRALVGGYAGGYPVLAASATPLQREVGLGAYIGWCFALCEGAL